MKVISNYSVVIDGTSYTKGKEYEVSQKVIDSLSIKYFSVPVDNTDLEKTNKELLAKVELSEKTNKKLSVKIETLEKTNKELLEKTKEVIKK